MPSHNQLRLDRRGFLQSSGLLLATAAIPFKTGAAMPQSREILPVQSKLLYLNYNENALGASYLAVKAAHAAVDNANRYTYQQDHLNLVNKIAALHRVQSNELILTQGSTEAIRGAINYIKEELVPGQSLQFVIPELTYQDGENFARAAGIAVKKVKMRPDWQCDIKALRTAVDDFAGYSIVYLVNPNNPTGSIIPSRDLEPWLNSKNKNVFFIIDEAYADFVTDRRFVSALHFVRAGFEQVIITRTFSKLFALAGLRVGYAVANRKNIQGISRYAGSFPLINRAGVAAAAVSLDDSRFIALSKQNNEAAKKITLATFKKLNLHYLQPESNFVFMRLKTINTKEFIDLMAKNNVVVGREFPPADNWARISFSTPEEMTAFGTILSRLDSQKLL